LVGDHWLALRFQVVGGAAEPRRRRAVFCVNPFGHIDLRVRELAAAQAFYDALLPALGFTERYHGDLWKVWATTEELPATAYFGITESRDHAPNENRIAFSVHARDDVDRLAAVAREAGAELSGPKLMPYGPGYYASFFEDPSGNLLEVYHRPAL
jgi:catechol 2,3-dioxygenase-like lactoylglutathione lyase family enzyme